MPPKDRRLAREAPKDPSELAKSIADQLSGLHYECANCLEVIRHEHTTWNCNDCFRVFHLGCIKKWAKQEESGEGRTFRCPHCQTPQKPATKYRCFCGKRPDPLYDPLLVPHTCGSTCGKRRGEGCPHPCPNQCHPGPCPECSAMVPAKKCPCGKTSYTYRCGRPDPMTTCSQSCGKRLSCGKHLCERPCHHGPCAPCDKVEDVACTCGKVVRTLPCGSHGFQCDQPCGGTQRCGSHQCNVVCHSGQCPPCDRDPKLTTTCPCGKSPLATERARCTDPIPTCGSVCGKVLACGRHYCDELCHDSPCAECTKKSQMHCPCKSTMAKVYCRDAANFRCMKKCKTRLHCGKHECEVICCAGKNDANAGDLHKCVKICNKKLSCGHSCQETCHKGACPACPNIITAPLYCRCGAEMIMPPLPCSTSPPVCRLSCNIQRPCGHPALEHECHFGDCPPCCFPVTRRCAGDHCDMPNVLCHKEYVVCAQQCGKPLSCGHACPRKCHRGPCIEEKKSCTVSCGRPLPCGHPCPSKCHPLSTPCGRCTTICELTCECNTIRESLPCAQYKKRVNELLRPMLRQHSASSNPSHPATPMSQSKIKPAFEDPDGPEQQVHIPCTADCIHARRLDVLKSVAAGHERTSGNQFHHVASEKVTKVIYSTRLWYVAQKQPDVVAQVESRLLEFLRSPDNEVMLPPMLKDKRAVFHELCHYFHITSESHDVEPNRTILLSKTTRSAAPTPLLTEAAKRADNDPCLYVESVLSRPDEAIKRIIVFEAERLSAVEVYRCLSPLAGEFVVIEATEENELEPRATKRKGTLGEDQPLMTYYAIFLPNRSGIGYKHLRQRGCTVLYHLIGHPSPPRIFSWEPERPATVRVPARRVFVDPLSGGGGDAPAAVAFDSLATERRPNAKERKSAEVSKIAIENKFAALRRE